MQYTYWDLSIERREAKALGNPFISSAEADLASPCMQRLLLQISRRGMAEENELATMTSLAALATNAVDRIEPFCGLEKPLELE